jgi:predicted DNA-binding protein (UPF0278 family)
MKIDKKLQTIESALRKIRDGREGWLDTDLTREEFDVIIVALEIAAGICTEAKLFAKPTMEKTA